jgi:hypothetical protein
VRVVCAKWLRATVHGDYDVEVDRHYCSVPHGLVAGGERRLPDRLNGGGVARGGDGEGTDTFEELTEGMQITTLR